MRKGEKIIMSDQKTQKTTISALKKEDFPKRLYSRKETARILGFSSSARLSMWAMRKKPNLPFVRFGKVVRYLEEDILNFIEENRISQD
jgi:hypothetical protein